MATATKPKRRLSPEAREALAQRNKDRAERLRAEKGLVPQIPGPAPASEGEVLPSQDDVFQQLVSLAQAAGGVAKKKQERGAILDQVATLLNGLDTTAYAELLERPEVEGLVSAITEAKAADPGVVPGADLGPAIGKKPWTIQDYMRPSDNPALEWIDYTPRKSDPVTINGVTIHFQEDVPIRAPRVFVEVAEQARMAPRLAKNHIDYMFRKTDQLIDPTIMSTGTQRVRGRYSGGLAGVGTGLALEVPDADRPGFDEIGGTEVGEQVEGAAA